VEGDRLLLRGALGTLVFDLKGKEQRLLFDGKVALQTTEAQSLVEQLAKLPAYQITAQKVYHAQGPYLAVDGWVWGAFPFSRRRFDTIQIDYLTTMRPNIKDFQATESLQFFRNERELLIGDSFGLWLVTLRKE
jgi:hypothetical protein